MTRLIKFQSVMSIKDAESVIAFERALSLYCEHGHDADGSHYKTVHRYDILYDINALQPTIQQSTIVVSSFISPSAGRMYVVRTKI